MGCLQSKEKKLEQYEAKLAPIGSRSEKSLENELPGAKIEMKRADSTRSEREDGDEEDENLEEEDTWTLIEMAKSLWASASAYLNAEEADEYNSKNTENLSNMTHKELEENVKAAKTAKKAREFVKKEEGGDDKSLAKAQRTSLQVSEGVVRFDGDLFTGIIARSLDADTKLVNAQDFLESCNSVPLLMGGLGRTFEFANSDLLKKLSSADQRMKEAAAELGISVDEVTLQDMIELDIKHNRTHAGKKAAPASRTILRLLWFTEFIQNLLHNFGEDQDKTLKQICSKTYEETLAPRHAWILRKAARSGMGLLPNKDVFRKRLGTEKLSQDEESSKLLKWSDAVGEVSETMWEYMRSKNLDTLP